MKSIRTALVLLLMLTVGVRSLEAARRPSQKQRVKVACVGNSITFGTGTPDPETCSYPAQLRNLLDTTRYDIRKFGRPGTTVLDKGHNPFVKSPEHAAMLEFAPDIAVIHIGINDTDPRNWPNYNDEFVSNLYALTQRLREVNPEVRLIMALNTPVKVTHPRFKSGTRLWRDKVRHAVATVAEMSGAEIIDFESPLMDRMDLLPDGLHPDTEGLGLLAQKVASAITGNYGGLQTGPLYTDNMVLQRNRPIRIAGTADTGARIRVSLGGNEATTVADNRGQWNVELPAMPATTGLMLKINDGQTALTYNNVAVGEVWVASGQSNMAFELKGAVGGKEAITEAADSRLRFFNMRPLYLTNSKQWTDSVMAEVNALRYYAPTVWQESSPESARDMSAVAYWFGKTLLDSLANVTVGIIANPVGGAGAESFIEPDLLMHTMPEVMLNWRKNDYVQPWVRQRAGENAPTDKNPLQRHPYEPTYLYSAGVRPLEGYDVEGVIWYQGESNAHNIEVHEDLFPIVVQSWRDAFRNPQMPLYFVQLSSIDRPSWPEFRDSQRKMANGMDNVEMAVSSDFGDSLDVHPRDKRPVGERLGRIALANLYGKSVIWQGPQPQKATLNSDGTVTVFFGSADGLTTSDGQAPRVFEVAEYDGYFVPATAAIVGENVVLTPPAGMRPRYVRYGWQPFTRSNLINSSQLPTSTFMIELSNSGSASFPKLIETAPDAEKGIEKGISAMYGASLEAGIVVAGGCNFPADDPIAPTATKQYYKGIYIFNPENPESGWKKVAELPEASAYGATFARGNEMIVIGGTTDKGNMTDIVSVLFGSTGKKPHVSVIGKLPFSIDNCGFSSAMGKGYLVGGNINGTPTNRVVVYDLAEGTLAELPPMPGNPRVQPTVAIAAGKLLVWGGFAGKHDGKEATLELGGLAYDFSSGKWSEVAGPTDANGEPVSVGGGCAASFAGGKVLVCGGVNKDVFLSALRNQDPDYLQHPVEWYRFNPDILLFEAFSGQWSVLGESKLCARAGALLLNCGPESALLFGGELKPRVRTPQSVIVNF